MSNSLERIEDVILVDKSEVLGVDEYGDPVIEAIGVKKDLTDTEIGRLKAIQGDSGKISHADRSVNSQLGCDSIAYLEQLEIQGKCLYLPVKLVSRQLDNLLSVIRDINFSIGDLIIRNTEDRLNAEELEEAHYKGEIFIPKDSEITEDGYIEVPLEPEVDFVLRPNITNDEIAYILRHGRSGLKVFQGQRNPQKVSSVIETGEFLVGAIRFSAGPYGGEIINKNDMRHLPARHLDPLRTTGVSGENNKFVQVELHNERSEAVSKEDVKIPIALYTSSEKDKKLFNGFSPETKKRVAKEGMTLADQIDITAPEFRARMFSSLDEKTSSVIISGAGVTRVDHSELYQWHKESNLNACMNGARLNDACFEDLSQALKQTQEQGRILVTNRLGSISHLEELFHRGGVRHIFCRGVNDNTSNFNEQDPLNDFYMTEGKHKKLIDLSRQGLKVYWYPESVIGDEEPREFYQCGFVKLDAKDRFDVFLNGGVSYAMFGSAQAVVDGYENEIDWLYEKFYSLNNNSGIYHGNGPHLMELAQKFAGYHNLFSCGMGMDFEQVGEHPNFTPDMVMFYNSDQIEGRQSHIEKMHIFPWLNLGGKGSWYELSLSYLKPGIYESLPVPITLFDITGSGYWHSSVEQVRGMARKKLNGYEFEKAFSQDWADKLMFETSKKEVAAGNIQDFMEDPGKFWAKIGITPEEIQLCFRNHQKSLEQYGIVLPEFLSTAVSRY